MREFRYADREWDLSMLDKRASREARRHPEDRAWLVIGLILVLLIVLAVIGTF